jgi:undecaprenyl pyrophosphate phosphatase UppP
VTARLIRRALCGLSPRQAAAVAFLAAFVTVLGALALAFILRRRNARKAAAL